MNEQEIRRWLWQHGYGWDPTLARGPYLNWASWDALPLNNPTMIHALRSCQAFNYSAMDLISEEMNREPHLLTGVVRSVTDAYMHSPRCPLPDFPPPNGAAIDFDDDDLSNAVQSMQAVGSGSWPQPCQKHGVTYAVDKRNIPDAIKGSWQSIIDDVVGDIRKRGCAVQEAKSKQHVNIRISWERNLGGRDVIGLAQYNNERCDDSVFLKMHPDYHPDDDQNRQLTEHEMLHNLNCPHTPSGIMSPNITDGWVGLVNSDPSVPRMKRFFGSDPIDDPEPPTQPPLPPGDNDLRLTGVTTVMLDGKNIGQFIFEPHVEI